MASIRHQVLTGVYGCQASRKKSFSPENADNVNL
jgi:hypothetical protein